MTNTFQPQSNTIITPANVPLLPAWTLTRPAPVTSEAPKMGDTVTGQTARGVLVTGKVVAIGRKVVTGFRYVHVLSGSMTHEIAIGDLLPSKMAAAPVDAPLMDEDTAPVIETKHDLYQTMKEAEETYIHYMRMDTFDLPADHATYKRKVASHIAYLQAQAAFTGLSNDALITYLYGKNALQSRQKADSSPVTASQVTASEMAETPAPLTQADGDTWLSRMRARELSFAKQAAKQWGIAPSDAPRQPVKVTVKPPRAMTNAEQANHDALQKMIDASRKAN